jgi:hypothetical protein
LALFENKIVLILIIFVKVPFGEVDTVKTYLALEEFGAFISKPENEHPARKVIGFACHRKEPSGLKYLLIEYTIIKFLLTNE